MIDVTISIMPVSAIMMIILVVEVVIEITVIIGIRGRGTSRLSFVNLRIIQTVNVFMCLRRVNSFIRYSWE